MSPGDVAEWAEAYRVAWENADSEAAARLFAENATYRDNIYQDPHVGRDGVADYWSGVTTPQSEVMVRMGAPFVDGDRAVVEFWTTMEVEGEPATLGGALLLRFDDAGACVSLREYYEFTNRVVDPPAEWGT